jgi:hypothetical protein
MMEGMEVAEQKAFQRRVEEELQPQRAAVREGYDKSRQASARLAHLDFAKGGPIGLGLFAGKDLQTQEGFPLRGTQLGHDAAQLDHTARIAARFEHLEQAGGAQTGILLESLAEEVQVGISQPGATRRATAKALGFQSPAHGVGMQAELGRNGTHLPRLGLEPVTDLSLQFSSDQRSFSRANGLTHPAGRPHRQQHSESGGSRRQHPSDCRRSKAAPGGWAGAVILPEAVSGWEP